MAEPKKPSKPRARKSPPPSVPDTPPAPPQANAVVIEREFADGGFKVQVRVLGDVRVTEVKTILEEAYRQVSN